MIKPKPGFIIVAVWWHRDLGSAFHFTYTRTWEYVHKSENSVTCSCISNSFIIWYILTCSLVLIQNVLRFYCYYIVFLVRMKIAALNCKSRGPFYTQFIFDLTGLEDKPSIQRPSSTQSDPGTWDRVLELALWPANIKTKVLLGRECKSLSISSPQKNWDWNGLYWS